MSTEHRLPGFSTSGQMAGPPPGGDDSARDRISSIKDSYRRPLQRPFRRDERDRVTLLFGSLSSAHDRLLKATLQGLGYRADHLPMPGRRDFQAGREYCNPGQCNPVYFVTGALIRCLERLRDEEGLSPDRIVSDYVFVTAGSCGPCRFGMYEAEYQLALRKAGFEGFRVIAFDKKAGGDGHDPGEIGDGFELNVRLYRALLNAIYVADILNAVTRQLRPYAAAPHKVDEVMDSCIRFCEERMRKRRYAIAPGLLAWGIRPLTPFRDAEDVAQLLAQPRERDYVDALRHCRKIIGQQLEINRIKPKPVVKITGEFWAQTTEGDGNFRMFGFLEDEGAEVRVEPLAAWVDYMRHNVHAQLKDRRVIACDSARAEGGLWPLRWTGAWLRYLLRDGLLRLTGILMRREYERLRAAMGATTASLPRQGLLQHLGHPYYDKRITGGEGYLEIAKNLHAFHTRQAHMTLSLKPFGCMPSTQSDGAQAAVMGRYPELNFLPVETSGDGEVNAYSRVQMALTEAKEQCRREFQQALRDSGWTREGLAEFVRRHPALQHPLCSGPKRAGVIGTAANLAYHAAALRDSEARRAAHPSARAARGASGRPGPGDLR
jgi:predicted nucleotide-binding protein (sugar kinase/HSP70/actin superfamily)